MNKQEQIEEIMNKEEFDELLKIIGEKRTAHARAIKNKGTLPNPKGRLNRYIANGICFAGYRKADEVRKEAVHEITKKVIVEVEKVHDNQFIACMTRIVKRIAAEYGVEVNDEK